MRAPTPTRTSTTGSSPSTLVACTPQAPEYPDGVYHYVLTDTFPHIARGFAGQLWGEQEQRLRHFHVELERRLAAPPGAAR